MASQDKPIRQAAPNQTSKDKPIQVQLQQMNSEDTQDFLAVQSSFLDNYLNGTSVVANYNHYKGAINKKAEADRLAKQKAQQDISAVTEEFVSNPYGTTGVLQQSAEIARMAAQQAKQQGGDVDKQYAEALAGDTIDMEAINREAAMSSMYKVLSDLEAEVTFGDKTMDFFAGFVPGLSTYKGYDVTGDVWNQSEGVARAIRKFKSEPIEVQERIFPIIKEELREKTNDAQAYRLLSQFLEPTGGEEVDEFSNLETVLDAADLTGIGFLFGQFAKGAKQGYNLTKSMKRVNNDQGAVDSAVASLADENIRRATNQDEVTATGNALPFDTSIEDIGHSKSLSGKVYNELKEFFGEADKTAEDIMLGRGFLKEGIVGTRTRAELEEQAMKKFKAEQAEDMHIIAQDENQTTFAYKILDEDGNLTEQEYTMNLTLDDAGMWRQETSGIVSNFIASPTVIARSAELSEDVATAVRTDYLTARINRQLTELTRKAYEPLGSLLRPSNKEALARVDNALIQGDEWKNADGTRGTVFSPEDLQKNYGLNEKERSVYYRINRINNNLWRIRNHEVRQEKVALGFKDVQFTRNSEHMMGKPFDNPSTASASLRTNNVNNIYDADADEIVNIKNSGDGFFKKAYEEDKVIVRLDGSYDIGGDRGRIRYTMVNKDEVGELPQQVLQRKVGYVPRVYESNVYFVKEVGKRAVDGDKTEDFETTLRFFDNKREADEYIDKLVNDELSDITDPIARKSLEEDLRIKYQRRSDRESEILAGQVDSGTNGSGGLYTGQRAQDDILFGLNGDKAQRVNSFEALTRNIGNLSRFTSINQWRLGLEQRWVNTANEMFRRKGIDKRVDSLQRLDTIAEGVDEVRFLNRMHDQIRDWQNFPTESERFFQTVFQNMYDFTKDKGFNRTAKVLGNFRNSDPVSAARATAFHSLLGWFNPAQFWVQAQGMSIAYSLGLGKYAGKAMADAIALRSVGMGATDSTRYALASKATKHLTFGKAVEGKELERLRELWEKTGYQDSVLQTADHAAAAKGYGITMDAIKRTADRGLLFYRQGELTNRAFSFTTAIERWKERTGKTLMDVTDDNLRDIMDDANAMMLNMTRANRASWQKGLPSLPTQFLQVTTKFLETSLGLNGQFSRGERGRMLLGQLGLYGTAGVPVLGMGTMMATEIFGMTQQDIEENPTIVKAINDGFWGVASHQIFGVDIELSSRGSLVRGIGDFVDNWFIQESTITEKLLGAFGSTQQNFVDSFIRQLRPFTISNMGNIDFEDVGSLLASPVLDSISTWRNVEKAEFMYRLGEIHNKRGRVVVEGDFDFMDAVAQGIGFQHTEFGDTYDLSAINRHQQGYKSRIVDEVLLKMNDFAVNHPNGDYTEEEFEEHMRDISMMYGTLDPQEQMEAIESVHRVITGKSRRDLEIQRFMERTIESTASQINGWQATAVGNKLIRFGTGQEEEE